MRSIGCYPLSPYDLQKTAAQRLAEAGCSTHEIASITSHTVLAEVERYTRAVGQKRLAREVMRKMSNETGGLSNRLNKRRFSAIS